MKEKIKIFLKNNWFKISLLAIIIIIIGGAFYWFQWRPSEIRKECQSSASYINTGTLDFSHPSNWNLLTIEEKYKYCLRQHGLEN